MCVEMQFIFGLGFQVFYIKQSKKRTVSCVYEYELTLAFTGHREFSPLPSGGLNYRQAHDVLEKELFWKSGGQSPILISVWALSS